MKAAARVAWFYCTLFPIQRWLGIVALALTALFAGFVIFALLGAGRAIGDLRAIIVPVFVTPVIFLMPAVLAAGALFRYISAPHTHRLLPGLRRKVLGSIVLLAGAVTVFGWALVLGAALPSMASPGAAGSPISVGPGMFSILAGVSGMLYFVFLMTHASRWTLIVVVAFILSLQLLGRLTEFLGAYPDLSWYLMALVVVGWVVFGIWYLRVPRIAPADWTRGHAGAARVLKMQLGGIGRSEVAGILVTGRAPFRLASAVLGTAVMGVLLSLFMRWILPSDAWTEDASSQIEIALMSGIGVVSALVVNGFGSRTRYLWLLEHGVRAALFRQIERAALRHGMIWIALIASAVASLHLLVTGLGIERVVVSVLYALGFLALAAYASLFRCRNFGFGEGGLIVLLCVVFIGLYVFIIRAGWPPGFVAVLAMVEIAAALSLRAHVVWRWRGVDWLKFRVIRPAQSPFGLLGDRRTQRR